MSNDTKLEAKLHFFSISSFKAFLYNRSLAGILGYGVPFSPLDPPAHVHHLRAAIVLFSAFLRTWRAVGRGIFPLFHLTIVLASLLVHVWMAARSVTVTGTTSRPLPTSSSTCRTGGTLSRIPRAGVLYWDDIDNGTLSIEFSMLLFCPPATSRAAPEILCVIINHLIISHLQPLPCVPLSFTSLVHPPKRAQYIAFSASS